MDPEATAVEASARAYLTASRNADYDALWHLMSRGAQSITLASASDYGLPAENGPAMLEAFYRQSVPAQGPADISIHVVDIVGDVAEVMLTGGSETLPFIREDEDWKLGVKGLHTTRR